MAALVAEAAKQSEVHIPNHIESLDWGFRLLFFPHATFSPGTGYPVSLSAGAFFDYSARGASMSSFVVPPAESFCILVPLRSPLSNSCHHHRAFGCARTRSCKQATVLPKGDLYDLNSGQCYRMSMSPKRQKRYGHLRWAIKCVAAAFAAGLPVFVSLGLTGCEEPVKHRPYGFLRVGPASDFLQTETYRPDLRMLFRRDERGLSVMSTLCTHDLSPLKLTTRPNGAEIFISEYSESQYRKNGRVMHGPAEANLPFYRLKIDEGVYGGPVDTLYVEVGAEVSSDWRLPVTVRTTPQK